jgi:hypothetical protein
VASVYRYTMRRRRSTQCAALYYGQRRARVHGGGHPDVMEPLLQRQHAVLGPTATSTCRFRSYCQINMFPGLLLRQHILVPARQR